MNETQKAFEREEWLHQNEKRKCRRLSLDAMGILPKYEKLTAALEPIVEGYQASVWEGWVYSPDVNEVAELVNALQELNNLITPRGKPAWLFDEENQDEK